MTERSPGNEVPDGEKVEKIFVLNTLIPIKFCFLTQSPSSELEDC